MIDFIVDWLDTSEASYKRIRDYIRKYHSWTGYNKLLMDDYAKYLFGDERQRYIEIYGQFKKVKDMPLRKKLLNESYSPLDQIEVTENIGK